MRQVNLNLNAIKGMVSKLKVSEKQADKAVDKVVEQAVEQAVSKSLLKDETKLDTVEIHTKVEKEAKAAAETVLKGEEKPLKEKKAKAAEVVSPKKDDKAANNTLKTVVLGALTTPKAEPVAADNSVTFSKTSKKEIAENIVVNNTQGVSGVDPTPPAGNITAIEEGGEISATAFNNLVAQWNNLDFDTATYEQKLALMDQIINAAQREADALNPDGSFTIHEPLSTEDPNYQAYADWKVLQDKANEWRCYKFMMRNNYQLRYYREIETMLAQGVSFDEIFSGNLPDVEIIFNLTTPQNYGSEMLARLGLDISRYFSSEDNEDFVTTNPIYGDITGDEYEHNSQIMGYDYDNEGFQYFGGEIVAINPTNPGDPAYTYVQNTDPVQRFLYNEAMIAAYNVKNAALNVKLQSFPDEEHRTPIQNTVYNKLLLDKREYSRILANLSSKRAELCHIITEQNLMNDISLLNDSGLPLPSNGYVPGLYPPEPKVESTGFELPKSREELQQFYNSLKNKYEQIYGSNSNAGGSHGAASAAQHQQEPDQEKQIEMLEALIEAADRLGLGNEKAHWQALLNGLNNGNGGGRGVEDNSLKFGDNTENVTPTLGNSVKPSKESPKNDDVLPELFAVPNKLAEEVLPEVVIKPDKGIPEEILEETKFEEVLPEVVIKPNKGMPEEILEETKPDEVLPKAAVQPDEVIPEEEPKITEQEQNQDLISEYTQQFLDIETKYNDEYSQNLTAVTPGTREYKLQLKRLTELLNHICKMLDENGYNDQAHADFWKNKFKVLIAQWPSSERPFIPEHRFSRPDQM